MYCKKCKYHAFDHVGTCPKCGFDWEETRKALYLNWLTSRGHDWFAAPAPHVEPPATETTASTENRPQPAPLPEEPKQAISHPPIEELEVGYLPDLDFGLDDAKPLASKAPTAPKPPKTAPPAADLFLGDTSSDDLLELDFSLATETPPAPTPKPAPAKREELFIPELEEMLAPLTDEPKSSSSGKATKKQTIENDIYLDFAKDRKSAPVKPDIAELDLLDFDVKK